MRAGIFSSRGNLYAISQRCRIVLDWLPDAMFGWMTVEVPAAETPSR
jgi:hypothetical protein